MVFVLCFTELKLRESLKNVNHVDVSENYFWVIVFFRRWHEHNRYTSGDYIITWEMEL